MKKILFLVAIVLAFASCDKKSSNMKLRPDATILLKSGVETRGFATNKTALEIVQETVRMNVQSYRFANQIYDEPKQIIYGFAERQRDYETPALMMLSSDIIDVNGDLVLVFLETFDVFLVDDYNDTIAYIPNEIITDARIAILDAYEKEDYETVYNLFENAYKFYPFND